MKIRGDIVQTYRDVHSWVGIISALFLFVAFYAGAISMLEQPLQDWLSPAVHLPAPVPLARTPELLARIFADYPEARENYTIVLADDAAARGRVIWSPSRGQARGPVPVRAAGLDADGALVTSKPATSQTARFIDVLHQQVGLPLPHETAMIVMGVVALLYAIALISGVIAYLPSLAKTLFAVRIDGGARKRWLDFHNLLGIFSLPFHIVMALTSVVFAFHEQIFSLEHMLISPTRPAGLHQGPRPMPMPHRERPSPTPVLPPMAILEALTRQAPGFVPETLNYTRMHDRMTLRVTGHDDRYSLRGPTEGFANLDPSTGRIISADYMPGHQPAAFAILTTFFALHFGSFGGVWVRWGYVVLGFGGAFLFYTGNRLWIVSRRRRERRSGLMRDTRGTRFLEALTSGCTLGCIAGISAIFCASPYLTSGGEYGSVSMLYYSVFAIFVTSGFILPPPVAHRLHLAIAGIITLGIPVALAIAPQTSLLSPIGGSLTLCTVLIGFTLLFASRRPFRATLPPQG
ncbi:PepSY-associated TM helix domain-containing protein [Brytella acorum]|uniref:PepSY-associated TM helix domain-containing protein n=1 Tax=Brytella acorum TaxID=2959299 RepID=A0AA35UUZ2_9PROT|nr:PepSY-associated TM helix domain-containing protein [Brytella acorum]MDF3623673.1 PepSY-associated TM helix domain-containing protein [Brytella acorum]CAI9119909.1 PepSY-associated TM helix domain-containing protein [Brytella acorum]